MTLNLKAWDKKYKKIMKVNQIDFEKKTVWLEADNGDHENKHTLTREFQDVIIMQSSGLKDKNGVESWEGNYLTKEGCCPFFIKRIENEGCLMAVPVNSVQRINWDSVPVKKLLDTGYVNNSNIYETPELLEGAE